MVIFLTYFILLWVVNAWHDADYYNGNDAHLSGWIFRILIVIGLFIFQKIKLKVRDIWDVVNIVVLSITICWITFDIAYNLFIGQVWYFKGTTSFLDSLFPNWLQFGLKALLLFYCIPVTVSFMNYLKEKR